MALPEGSIPDLGIVVVHAQKQHGLAVGKRGGGKQQAEYQQQANQLFHVVTLLSVVKSEMADEGAPTFLVSHAPGPGLPTPGEAYRERRVIPPGMPVSMSLPIRRPTTGNRHAAKKF